MAEDTDTLFIFGDDLEAILDALEEDEGVQEEFSATVSNASDFWLKLLIEQAKKSTRSCLILTNILAIICPCVCVVHIILYIVSKNSTMCVVCWK